MMRAALSLATPPAVLLILLAIAGLVRASP